MAASAQEYEWADSIVIDGWASPPAARSASPPSLSPAANQTVSGSEPEVSPRPCGAIKAKIVGGAVPGGAAQGTTSQQRLSEANL